MKRYRTLRGRFTQGTVRRLIVDDGRTTHALKVISFSVFGSASGDIKASLGTSPSFPVVQDASDNRQIAWSTMSTGIVTQLNIIDPDHVILTDLYVTGTSTTPDEDINYLIVVEPLIVTEDQAILSLIKERSQDDLR